MRSENADAVSPDDGRGAALRRMPGATRSERVQHLSGVNHLSIGARHPGPITSDSDSRAAQRRHYVEDFGKSAAPS